MTRRRRAVVEFLVTAVGLVLQLYGRTILRRRDDYDDPPAISAPGLVAGALYQLAFHAAYDRDVGKIRTNTYRVFAYGALSGAIQRWLFDREFQFSFAFGGLVGTILYRLWYGVLHPVPGEEN